MTPGEDKEPWEESSMFDTTLSEAVETFLENFGKALQEADIERAHDARAVGDVASAAELVGGVVGQGAGLALPVGRPAP